MIDYAYVCESRCRRGKTAREQVGKKSGMPLSTVIRAPKKGPNNRDGGPTKGLHALTGHHSSSRVQGMTSLRDEPSMSFSMS